MDLKFEYTKRIVNIININTILNEGDNASGASTGADVGAGVGGVGVGVDVGGVGNAIIHKTPLSVLRVMFTKSGDRKAKCGRICLIAIIACQRLFEP